MCTFVKFLSVTYTFITLLRTYICQRYYCSHFFRKNLRNLLRDQMMRPDSLLSLLPIVLEQYQKLTSDCKSYVSDITEVISDIHQPLVETRLKYSKEEIRQMELKVMSVLSDIRHSHNSTLYGV